MRSEDMQEITNPFLSAVFNKPTKDMRILYYHRQQQVVYQPSLVLSSCTLVFPSFPWTTHVCSVGYCGM